MREQLDRETHPSLPNVSSHINFSTSNLCPTNFWRSFYFTNLDTKLPHFDKTPRFVAIRLFVRHVGETWRMEGRRCYVDHDLVMSKGSASCRWGCGSHCKQIFFWAISFCDQTAGNGSGIPDPKVL